MKSICFPQVFAIALLLGLFSTSTSGAATPDEIRKALADSYAAKKDVSPKNLIFLKLLSEGKTLDEADAGKRSDPETAKTYEALTPDARKNLAMEFSGKIVDTKTLGIIAKELKLTVENADPQTQGRCAKCQAHLAPKARFCGECGTPVPQPVQVKACPSCGQKVSGGAFCPNCGASLKDAAASPMPAPPVSAPPSTSTGASTTDDSAELAKINAVDKTGGEKLDAKDYSAAAVDFIEGVNLSSKLAKKHPEQPVYKESVFYFADRAASALDLKGDTATALKMELQGVAGYKALVSAKNVSAETKQAAAGALGNLAWLQLKSRDPKGAAESSRQGLALDASLVWIKTNLAHALLFDGQFEEASKLYLAERLTKVNDQKTFQDAVLEDFEKFEKHGLKYPEMEKIRVLYGRGTPAAASVAGAGAKPSPPAPAAKKEVDFKPMAKAVEGFLVMLDLGRFAESYDAADASFREGATKEAWIESLKQNRTPLGAPKERSLTKVDTNTSLTSGKVSYVFPVISTFEKGSVIEDITVVKSADGQYRVADWSIKAAP